MKSRCSVSALLKLEQVTKSGYVGNIRIVVISSSCHLVASIYVYQRSEILSLHSSMEYRQEVVPHPSKALADTLTLTSISSG